MNTSYDKTVGVVVLPPFAGGRLQNKSLRAWLAKSDLGKEPAGRSVMARVVAELGLPYPDSGLAAMRMWGQTGDRPTNWIAAADAVYLEPRLDHLRVHAMRHDRVRPNELQSLIDYLQDTLAGDDREDGQIGFARLGPYGYLSSTIPIATASVSAGAADQKLPNEFLPTGEGSASHRNLISEIEMSLHDHEVNRRRVEAGEQPVNSLWLWGGGTAPEQITRPQLPLFSDDALMTGYWYSATAVAEPWPGDIASCIEESVAGFVAEIPESNDEVTLLEACLEELRAALRAKRLGRIILLFRDGVRAETRRSHAFRFWRRDLRQFD